MMARMLKPLGFAVVALGLVAVALAMLLGNELRHVVIAEPWWGLLVLAPLLAWVVRAFSAPRPATMRFSRVRTLQRSAGGLAVRLADLPDGLRLAATILLCLAAMRPQSNRTSDRIQHEGIDIVIALDLSDSMEAADLFPSRLVAAQDVIDEFIAMRPRDRIGVVVFGAHASTVSPLTIDHDVLRALVRRLQLGVLDGSRTAIGAGLGVALNRIKDSQADSKVVVLLTDGVHNAEGLDPDATAKAAAERGVKIFTVLMGRHTTVGPTSVDPARLEQLASLTGGFAYTATDQEALRTSFQDLLDKLERTLIEGEAIRAELFAWLLWPALLLLMLDVLLRSTRLRRFP